MLCLKLGWVRELPLNLRPILLRTSEIRVTHPVTCDDARRATRRNKSSVVSAGDVNTYAVPDI